MYDFSCRRRQGKFGFEYDQAMFVVVKFAENEELYASHPSVDFMSKDLMQSPVVSLDVNHKTHKSTPWNKDWLPGY